MITFLLNATIALAGNNSINGEVLDRNGEPIPRAIVALTPGNVELVTDHQGRFMIDYARDDDGKRIKLSKRIEYELEVFKPGYHVEDRGFYYRRGPLVLDRFTLVEDSIEIEDDGENLDPGLYANETHSAGANYEGQ